MPDVPLPSVGHGLPLKMDRTWLQHMKKLS